MYMIIIFFELNKIYAFNIMTSTFTYSISSYNPSSGITTTKDVSPTFSTVNPFATSTTSISKGTWYYYLVENDGTFNTLYNFNFDPLFNWYMCVSANGGLGAQIKANNGGGGGGGQIINIALSEQVQPNTINLYPVGTNSDTTLTSINFIDSRVINLYPGLNGSTSTSYAVNGAGGYGGSGTDLNSAVLGGAGGVTYGFGYQTVKDKDDHKYKSVLNGYDGTLFIQSLNSFATDATVGSVKTTLSDNVACTIATAGKMNRGGNTSSVLFYCTPT
jgi:hypothetical protein